jgi:hypothetical protein
MSSAAQIAANTANAQHSTGPVTEEGKAESSKNGITHGLFAMRDFVRPNEVDEYVRLAECILDELAPVGILETTLVDEIRRATWRLRRCGRVEATLLVRLASESEYILDPMEDDHMAATQKSVDRARAQAHRLLHKCTAELRRLQTERRKSEKEPPAQPKPGNVVPMTTRTQSQPIGTPRNAPCPCGSGQKHKRCCGQNAPPIVNAA